MPIHDFRCESCKHVHTELVKWDIETQTCPECGNVSNRVFLTAPKIDWLAMGAQSNVSPEFQERFDKMHRQQKEKEEASEAAHGEGEYGKMPGS